jgi:hypothetical protein
MMDLLQKKANQVTRTREEYSGSTTRSTWHREENPIWTAFFDL